MKRLALIALAGAAGALARYGMGGLVSRLAGGGFPWGTFAVNLTGCFLFGYVWSLEALREMITEETRAVLLIGFMGAFTTFSSFAFDNYLLWQERQWGAFAFNVAAQNILGFAGLWAGIELARRWP